MLSQISNVAPKSLPAAGKHRYNPSTASRSTDQVICTPLTLCAVNVMGVGEVARLLIKFRFDSGGFEGPEGRHTNGSSSAGSGPSPASSITSLRYSCIRSSVLPRVTPLIGLVVLNLSSTSLLGTLKPSCAPGVEVKVDAAISDTFSRWRFGSEFHNGSRSGGLALHQSESMIECQSLTAYLFSVSLGRWKREDWPTSCGSSGEEIGNACVVDRSSAMSTKQVTCMMTVGFW